jgi:uncharacterized membrane protein HdeD (DUF308 family)
VALLTGVVFIMFPDKVMDILVQVLGGVIILIALVFFLSLYVRKNAPKVSGISLFNLALATALGLLLIFKSSFFSDVAIIGFGIVLVIAGIMQLVMLSGTRRLGLHSAWYSYLFALLTLGIGIAIFFNPFDSKEHLITLLGCGLTFYGVTDLFSQIFVRMKLKKQGKHIVDGEIEDIEYEEVK